MNTKEVALEIVNYRTRDIEHTCSVFIRNFAQYSGILGTKEWIGSLFRLREIIDNQKPQNYVLPAEGVEINFSGFPNPLPVIKDNRVVFVSKEPRFTIFDTVSKSNLLPSSRNRIEEVVSQISEEMYSVYHLRVDKNPQSLIFPKSEYAKSITFFDAALITNPF